jgi:hypothetical protein
MRALHIALLNVLAQRLDRLGFDHAFIIRFQSLQFSASWSSDYGGVFFLFYQERTSGQFNADE